MYPVFRSALFMIAQWFEQLVFAYPAFLSGFILIPWIIFLQKVRNKSSLPVSSLQPYTYHATWKTKLLQWSSWIRPLIILFLLIALARPQRLFPIKEVQGQGIDILLCMDVSGSMLAEDFLPDRLSAAKEEAVRFIQNRPADRIGIVLFSGEAYTLCPITSDKKTVIRMMESVRSGYLEDGTAIGNGLAISLMNLQSASGAQKIILLLTDGENNAGTVAVADAANLAQKSGIRIYTIGVGSDGYAIMPTATPNGVVRRREKVQIDEQLLRSVAHKTGGRYFRAGNNQALDSVYREINLLELSEYTEKVTVKREEWYRPFALIALCLLLLECWIRYRLARTFP